MKQILKSFLFILPLFLGAVPEGAGGLFAQTHKTDSLKTQLQKGLHDTTRINTLNRLGWALMYQNPDTAIVLGKKALELAVKNGDSPDEAIAKAGKNGQGNSNSNLGVYYWLKGDYPLSLSYHFKALETRKQRNDKKGISVSLGNIGIVYQNQGDYPKVLEYYFKALKMDEELGNKNGIARHLGNIGIVYHKQGDYPKALEYYFKALKMDEELGNKIEIAIKTGNIGIVYNDQGDYPKALEYYFKALKMDEELGNKNGIARHLGNIGSLYKDQGDLSSDLSPEASAKGEASAKEDYYLKALEYYFKALKMDEELGRKSGIAIRLGNIGSLYTSTKEYAKAEEYLLRALEIDTAIGFLNHTRNTHEALSNLYAETHRYRLAYEHHKAYGIAKDLLFNEEKSKDLGKLEARHEFEMAEAERKRIEEEQAKQAAAAKSRRDNLQYSGILIFMVLLFAGVFALGRLSIPVRLAEGMIFFSFLLFFEFTLVLLDPYIEQYSAGAPAIKLAFNAVLAGLIFPLHSFFENRLKNRLVK